MSASDKRAIAARLLAEADAQEGRGPSRLAGQEKDFDNPFSTSPTTYNDVVEQDADGTEHGPGLHPVNWTRLRLAGRSPLNQQVVQFTFSLPKKTDHTGCLPGQYVQVRIWQLEEEGDVVGDSRRYYSPTSKPNDYGKLEVVVNVQREGVMARHMRVLQVGDESLEFRGPCGGFEYYPNSLDYLVAVTAGVGVTPGVQLLRSIQDDPKDKCRCVMIIANNTPSDIILLEELTERSNRGDNKAATTFVVSDISDSYPNPMIEEAFVDHAFLRQHLPKELLRKRFKVVVCGGTGFSVSVLHALRSHLVPPECVFVFGSTGTQFVKAVFGCHAFLSSHKSNEFPSPWRPRTTTVGAAMAAMKSELCNARLIVTPEGRRRVLLANRDVCRGIRFEGWAKKPELIPERGGNFYISADRA